MLRVDIICSLRHDQIKYSRKSADLNSEIKLRQELRIKIVLQQWGVAGLYRNAQLPID